MQSNKRFTLGFLITLAIVLASYGLYETRDLLRGPLVYIDTIKDMQTVHEPFVTVGGSAGHVANITLNGRAIFTDKTGRFTEKLLVPEGYTILELVARDTFAREVRQRIHIYYKSNS